MLDRETLERGGTDRGQKEAQKNTYFFIQHSWLIIGRRLLFKITPQVGCFNLGSHQEQAGGLKPRLSQLLWLSEALKLLTCNVKNWFKIKKKHWSSTMHL